MDCNKDEAAKAKGIAEKKLQEKDFEGSRKFAMKAQSLYSGLDGLQQLLMTLKVYTSAEKKINGEVDWYGVLDVDPSSNEDTLKKQYRKLALTLHPDKNKSVGAEGAFKLLSEAWSLLSDKSKRTAYDQKRKVYGPKRTSVKGMYEKVIPTQPSKPTGRDTHRPSSNNFNASHNAPNPHLAPPKRPKTFWTVCTSCQMQFEYVLHYLNKKLQCFNCKEPFQAIPIAPPQTMSQATIPGHMPSNGPAIYSGDLGGVPAYSSASNLNGAQLSHGNLKKMNEYTQVSATLEDIIKGKTNAKRVIGGDANGSCSLVKGQKPRKRRRSNEPKMSEIGKETSDQTSMGSRLFGVGTVGGASRNIADTDRVTTVGSKSHASIRESSLLETRNLLIGKAKEEIFNKLNEWTNSIDKPKVSNKSAGLREKKSKVRAGAGTNLSRNADANRLPTATGKSSKNLEEEHETSSASNSMVSDDQASADLSMTVPDSDFHDFDKGRTESSFGDNQVWASYDDDDGMPRFYAMIHNVLSRKPFKMRISWLNSKSTAEFGNMNWVAGGFYKTSGDFRVGKHELNRTVNSFSHRVKWTKGFRGAIRIHPSKGDVWALYKNWSSEWSEHTPEEIIHCYEMVEVLADYSEEKGIIVIPLVKVAGFKTVYRPHMDRKEVRVIPREEMFRFSHQVPSRLVTGDESPNAPKGCLELDPAAMPVELIKVVTEAREHLSKESSEGARDNPSEVENFQATEPVGSNIAKNEAMMVENGIRTQLGTATVV